MEQPVCGHFEKKENNITFWKVPCQCDRPVRGQVGSKETAGNTNASKEALSFRKEAPSSIHLTRTEPSAKKDPRSGENSNTTRLSKSPPNEGSSSAQLQEYLYEVQIPITPEGLLILINETSAGHTRFMGYRKSSQGNSGPAEMLEAFAGIGDRFVVIDGITCSGMS
jgi:hypothetical protein